ncbi:hypothetical protein PIB30_049258 [Stylosanthes scabra]|uniref:Uncharacterized protein n=1 Tax=Stylosanthes scabra TaxID=79078 RepID=A0ABU6UKN5_9FABA|nr:hypothetical protein [Stylosanthes scabra]
MAPRGRSRRVARAEPDSESAEEAPRVVESLSRLNRNPFNSNKNPKASNSLFSQPASDQVTTTPSTKPPFLPPPTSANSLLISLEETLPPPPAPTISDAVSTSQSRRHRSKVRSSSPSLCVPRLASPSPFVTVFCAALLAEDSSWPCLRRCWRSTLLVFSFH